MEFINGNAVDVHRNAARTSCRPKTTPIARNEDFLRAPYTQKNSVVDVSVRTGNCVRCKPDCVYKQNICGKNTSEVQKFKIVIDKEDKCKSVGQRSITLKIQLKDITVMILT